jgi:hypothetical protein
MTSASQPVTSVLTTATTPFGVIAPDVGST